MNSAVETLSVDEAMNEQVVESQTDKPIVESQSDATGFNPHSDGPGFESSRTDTLIKAALSLSQAIEALGSLNLFGEVQPPDVKRGIDFYAEVRRFEVALITEALRVTHGCQRRAAVLLGLHTTTLNCMIKRLDVGTTAMRSDARGAANVRGHARASVSVRANVEGRIKSGEETCQP
jgi:DNA-binding NtrC family response regulator